MKKIVLVCEKCGISFDRLLKEYKRNAKVNRNIFCSRSCAGEWHLEKNPLPGNVENLRRGSEKNELSPFRWYIKVSKRRALIKNVKFDLDLEYLKKIWENQNGICPYTKTKMNLHSHDRGEKANLKSASLDRIIPSEGYIQGNVEFVSLFINFAKNHFPKENVLDFLNEMKINN